MENEGLPLLGAPEPAPGIPGRACMWLLSWVFVFASIFLTAEFILLHLANPPQNELINFFGTIEAVLWLQGFTLLLYWSFYEVPIQPSGCFATFLKFVASCFFNVQPASALIQMQPLGNPWGNFVGICLFHSGNLLSCFAMMDMFDRSKPLSEANLPVLGMWVYTLATTFLVTADGLDYYEVESATDYIKFGQICGGTLLLVGSIMYCYWSRPSTFFPKSVSAGNSIQ